MENQAADIVHRGIVQQFCYDLGLDPGRVRSIVILGPGQYVQTELYALNEEGHIHAHPNTKVPVTYTRRYLIVDEG